jgi:hypothetical protein
MWPRRIPTRIAFWGADVLIKATRIRSSAGADALVRHLANADDNESIAVLQGLEADLHDAVADARRFGRAYALRHFIIAPELDIDREQLRTALEMLAEEFGFNPQRPLVVEHAKKRAVEGVSGRHWHIVVPEVDPASGRVLSSRYDHARHEKLSRLMELAFGHRIVPGAHDRAVMAALRQGGRSDLANRLSDHLGHTSRPVEDFSTKAHQAAKRSGTDLALVRANIREAWKASRTGPEFRQRLADHGLALATGEKDGVLIVRGVADDLFLGAAHRLAGVRRSDFTALIERTDHDPRTDSNNEPRAGDPDGHAGAPQRHGDDPVAGPGDRPATAGRGEVLPRNRNRAVADDRDRGGGKPAEPRSAPPASQRPGHPGYAAAHDGGLTGAIRRAASALTVLTRSDIRQPYADRVRGHLGALEAQARARIAAATAKPGPEPSKRLAAARLYHQSAVARLDLLWKDYRALQDRMAVPAPAPNLLARLLGPKVPTSEDAALEREHATLHAALIAAERTVTSAAASVAQAERTDAAAHAAHADEIGAELRAANDALGEVLRSKRIMTVFPAIVFAGPVFTAWTGQRIERRRRDGPRNPQAKTIWGLPIDFG